MKQENSLESKLTGVIEKRKISYENYLKIKKELQVIYSKSPRPKAEEMIKQEREYFRIEKEYVMADGEKTKIESLIIQEENQALKNKIKEYEVKLKNCS